MLSILPPNYAALVYALVAICIAVLGMQVLGLRIPQQKRIAGSWVALTVAAFFSVGIWMHVILLAIVWWVAMPRDTEERTVYFIGVLPALPKFEYTIPGFAGIESLFMIDYARLLSLVVLLPLALAALQSNHAGPRMPAAKRIDLLFFLYVFWLVFLAFQRNGLTQGLRATFEQLVFVALPYLAVSRLLTSPGRVKEALSTILYSALIVATIGIFCPARLVPTGPLRTQRPSPNKVKRWRWPGILDGDRDRCTAQHAKRAR